MKKYLIDFEYMSRLGEIVTEEPARTVWMKTTWRLGGVMSAPKSVS